MHIDANHTSRRSKALLLAGGLGSRLRPITDTVPKCLVEIAGRPLLDYWFDALASVGVRDVLINTHHLPDAVREYIAWRNAGGMFRVEEAYEPELLGSAGTITANREFADDADDVFIIYADNLSSIDLVDSLRFHQEHGDPFTMLLFRAANPSACGIAELDEDGRVTSFVEKPDQPTSDLANAGVYLVTADAYREIADQKAFDLGFDVLPRFVGRMRGLPLEGFHLDVGTHEALAIAVQKAPDVFGRFRPAAFLDRDGTIIEHVHHLADPDAVRLIPGAAEAIHRLQAAGFACVVITNQSVVGRGDITEQRLAEIHSEMDRQLSDQGITMDGLYYCTLAPTTPDRSVIEHPDRKPGPGMLHRAAEDLHLDPRRSWMVGDSISDVLAGSNANCAGNILVRTGCGANVQLDQGVDALEAHDIGAAADLILRSAEPASESGLHIADKNSR